MIPGTNSRFNWFWHQFWSVFTNFGGPKTKETKNQEHAHFLKHEKPLGFLVFLSIALLFFIPKILSQPCFGYLFELCFGLIFNLNLVNFGGHFAPQTSEKHHQKHTRNFDAQNRGDPYPGVSEPGLRRGWDELGRVPGEALLDHESIIFGYYSKKSSRRRAPSESVRTVGGLLHPAKSEGSATARQPLKLIGRTNTKSNNQHIKQTIDVQTRQGNQHKRNKMNKHQNNQPTNT